MLQKPPSNVEPQQLLQLLVNLTKGRRLRGGRVQFLLGGQVARQGLLRVFCFRWACPAAHNGAPKRCAAFLGEMTTAFFLKMRSGCLQMAKSARWPPCRTQVTRALRGDPARASPSNLLVVVQELFHIFLEPSHLAFRPGKRCKQVLVLSAKPFRIRFGFAGLC